VDYDLMAMRAAALELQQADESARPFAKFEYQASK
jgi:hypothetical protein